MRPVVLLREVMADAPAAYYPLQEVSGSVADRSGNGRASLAPSGGPSYRRRGLGGGAAIGFDGVDDMLSAAVSTFTCYGAGAFVHVPADVGPSSANRVVSSFGNGSIFMGGFTGSLVGEVVTALQESGGAKHSAWAGANVVLRAGWHHIFVGHQTSSARWEVFVDGALVSNLYNGAVNSGLSASTLYIGRHGAGGSFFGGSIGHAYWVPASLVPNRIRAHAAEGLGWLRGQPRHALVG